MLHNIMNEWYNPKQVLRRYKYNKLDYVFK
jgi:hypothetical protein